MKTLLMRLMEKVEVIPEGCWIWTGYKRREYGSLWVDGKPVPVHRLSYEIFKGPIPKRHHVHHDRKIGCTSKACINPDHLKTLTPKEHLKEHEPRVSGNALKTHCPRGHEYAPENTISQPNGGRGCRRCHADLTLSRYHSMTPEEKARRNEVRQALRARKPDVVTPEQKERWNELRRQRRAKAREARR